MRTPDVVKATAAGFWSSCRTTAAPIAIAAATMQETMKIRMFVMLSKGQANHYGPARAGIKRSNVAMAGHESITSVVHDGCCGGPSGASTQGQRVDKRTKKEHTLRLLALCGWWDRVPAPEDQVANYC